MNCNGTKEDTRHGPNLFLENRLRTVRPSNFRLPLIGVAFITIKHLYQYHS